MTNTATKITATTATVTTDKQLDALDSLPAMFPETPVITEPAATQIVPIATADASLEALKDIASVEKISVENALKGDSRATFAAAMEKAQAAVKAYNDALLKTLFDRFLQDGEPMLAFMRLGFYNKLRISANEKGKEGPSVTLDEKAAVLPLARFVSYANTQKVVQSASWQSKVQRVTALLSVRAAQDIGQDVTQMLVDYEMDELARGMVKKDVKPREKNPISNGTLVKAMQDMLDDVLFIANDKGMNTYRVVTPALMFFLYILFRRGSKPGTIATPRAGTVENFLVEIAHMMVVGIDFSVEYKKVQTVEKAAA